MTALRRPGAASAAVLLGLTAGFVTAHTLAPEWARRAGLDVWNYTGATEQLRAASGERDEVYAAAERAALRRAVANQIAAKLAAGEVSLPAAADELRLVFRDDAGVRCILESHYCHLPTEHLRFARHAIDRVKRVLAENPGRSAAVTARLEADLRSMAASPNAPVALRLK